MPPKRPRPPASPKRARPAIARPLKHRRPGAPRLAQRPAPPPPPPKSPPRPKAPDRKLAGAMTSVFGDPDTNSTLLDLVDNLLSKGVVLHADAILALADVDLVYLRLTALLAAADRIFPKKQS